MSSKLGFRVPRWKRNYSFLRAFVKRLLFLPLTWPLQWETLPETVLGGPGAAAPRHAVSRCGRPRRGGGGGPTRPVNHQHGRVSSTVSDIEPPDEFQKTTKMRSRDIFGRLRLRLRLRGSIPAPSPAPSKTFRRLRLRAKCTGSDGSGSGSGSNVEALIAWTGRAWTSSSFFFRNFKCKEDDLLLTWPWAWMLVRMSVFEICHPLSSRVTGWHWRNHRIFGVGLRCLRLVGHCLTPKWSFATEPIPRAFNIRRRISPRWRPRSVAWLYLIKN